MINDVKNLGLNKLEANTLKQKASQQTEQAQVNSALHANTPKASTDSVNITPQARNLQNKVSTAEAFDSEKVDKLKKAIANGEYHVNFDKLAQKLSQFEFDVYG